MQLKQLAATCALLSATAMVQAKPIWQDFSVTGLYGENYEVVDDKETTITLEYAAKVKYADVFFFMAACVAKMTIRVLILSYHHV